MAEENWINELTTIDFLKKVNKSNTYILKTPFQIEFLQGVVVSIYSHYKTTKEIGGLLLATAYRKGNTTKVVQINKVIFFKNISSTPEQEFRWKENIQSVWQEACKIDGESYIPFFFHSHPLIIGDASNFDFRILKPMGTSPIDQEISENLQIEVEKEFCFLLPNVLVVMSELTNRQILIGFYGGGIAPTDFSEYLMKLTGRTIQELRNAVVNWTRKNPNNKWVLVALGVVFAILTLKYSKQIIPILLVVAIMLLFTAGLVEQTKEKSPNYFGLLTKETAICIPE